MIVIKKKNKVYGRKNRNKKNYMVQPPHFVD